MILVLKGCRRCGGDLYYGCDRFGSFISCLQCGFLKDVKQVAQVNASSKPMPMKGRYALRNGSKKRDSAIPIGDRACL